MKKRLSSLVSLALALVLCAAMLPVRAHAAGVSFYGSDSLRGGDTVTVVCAVSGSNILAIEGDLSYDSSSLELLGTECLLGGDWSMQQNGNHVLLNDTKLNSPINSSTPVFSATFRVKSGAEAGSTVSASVSNMMASDGSSDFSLGGSSWGAQILRPLSGNSKLAQLSCSNASLSPAFDPSVTQYSVTVPFEVESLDLYTEADHGGASVSVSGNSLVVGSNTVTVTVVAEDGSTRRYTISVQREQDPNYVPSDDARLDSLTPSHGKLSPAFSSKITNYVVYVPYETKSIRLSGTSRDALAQEVRGSSKKELSVGDNVLRVKCTAEDGKTTKTYTVHVWRMPLYAGELPEIIPPVTEQVQADAGAAEASTAAAFTLTLPSSVSFFGHGQIPLAWVIGLVVVLVLAAVAVLFWFVGRRSGRKASPLQTDTPADHDTHNDGDDPSGPAAPTVIPTPVENTPAEDCADAAPAPADIPADTADNTAVQAPEEDEDEPFADDKMTRDFVPLTGTDPQEDVPVAADDGIASPVSPAAASVQDTIIPPTEDIPCEAEEDAEIPAPVENTAAPAPAEVPTAEAEKSPHRSSEPLKIPTDLADDAAVADLAEAIVREVLPDHAQQEDPLHGMSLDKLLRDIEDM